MRRNRLVPLRRRVLLLRLKVIFFAWLLLLVNERSIGFILIVLVLITFDRTFEKFNIPASCGLAFRTAVNRYLINASTSKAANEKTNDREHSYHNEKDLHTATST